MSDGLTREEAAEELAKRLGIPTDEAARLLENQEARRDD